MLEIRKHLNLFHNSSSEIKQCVPHEIYQFRDSEF